MKINIKIGGSKGVITINKWHRRDKNFQKPMANKGSTCFTDDR
jgi:hypothetical protein